MRRLLLSALSATLVFACDDEEPEAPAEPVTEEPAEEPEPEPEEEAGLQYDGPELACARAVLVAYDGAAHADDDVTRSKEEAETRAAELRERVTGGEDIAEVARAESDAASSGARGGLLGTYTRESWPGVHEPLKEPVFALEVGETTEVIEADYGYIFAKRCELDLIHTRHVLIRYEGARGAEDVDRSEEEARQMAEAIHQRITEGADFEEVAREESEDTSAEEGGDIGVVGRGVLAPEYEEAAYALEPGEVSDVVKSEFGFHVIQRIE